MKKQIAQLTNLIARKQSYLEKVENERTRVAVQVEINILEDTVSALHQAIETEFLNEITTSERETKMHDAVKTLEAICLLHGINDYPMYYQKGLTVLIDTLKELTRKQEVIIPNQLKLFYDEKI